MNVGALSNTEKEMLESRLVCENFNFGATEDIARKIGKKRVIFAGMGSSIIFPAKQAKNRALKFNISNRIDAHVASDLTQYPDFSDSFLFLLSNSGKTRESVLLLEHAKMRGATCIAVTAVPDSVLAQKCDGKIILSCGFEKGVAATKSVVEEGLILDSLIFHLAKNQGKNVDFRGLKKELAETGKIIARNAGIRADEALMEKLAPARNYFFVGLDTGVAEEITLKACEITGKLSVFYPGTGILHGPAEAIEGGVLLIFEPEKFAAYLPEFRKFSGKTHCSLAGIGGELPIPGLKVETTENFGNYCLLAGGWGMLRRIAGRLKIDIDHPKKLSKVMVPYGK